MADRGSENIKYWKKSVISEDYLSLSKMPREYFGGMSMAEVKVAIIKLKDMKYNVFNAKK